MSSNNENKRIDKIIDQLNKGEYESQMSDTLKELEKSDNLMAAIDTIVNESKNIDEIQCKVIMAIKEHAKNITPEKLTSKELGMEERKIAKDIAKFTKDITDKKINSQSLDIEKRPIKGAKLDKQKDKLHNITGESKKNLKNILKSFAIYEVYKVMNPRRIAGETAKNNYENNMYMGGEKLASKHTGGRKHEVEKYSKKFVKQAKKTSKAFRGKENSLIR